MARQGNIIARVCSAAAIAFRPRVIHDSTRARRRFDLDVVHSVPARPITLSRTHSRSCPLSTLVRLRTIMAS